MGIVWRVKDLVYDPLFRRIGPVHRLFRRLVWRTCEATLRIGEAITGFEVGWDEAVAPYFRFSWLVGSYEKEIIRLYNETLRPGMKVVDVGAHVGYHTVRLAKLVGPEGKVFAFEPCPSSFQVLCRNVRRKRLSNVVLEWMAVGNVDGIVSFYRGRHNLRHSVAPVGETSIRVTSVSLDSYFAPDYIIDFVKIDVEGAELKVLRGMERLVARSPDIYIILEFYPALLRLAEGERGPFALLQWLFARGFYVYEIRDRACMPIKPSKRDQEEFVSSVRKLTNLFATRKPWNA